MQEEWAHESRAAGEQYIALTRVNSPLGKYSKTRTHTLWRSIAHLRLSAGGSVHSAAQSTLSSATTAVGSTCPPLVAAV